MTIPSPSSSASFHVPRRVKGRKRERRGVYINHRKTAISAKGENGRCRWRGHITDRQRGVQCVWPAVPQPPVCPSLQRHARRLVHACRQAGRGWWRRRRRRPPPPTLYRFVDETTVIRHCVWPHPRPPPRFMALLRHPPRGPIISARPQRDLLPIPIASLDCNYTVTVCMACQNFPRSINGFNGISSQRLIAFVWFRSLFFFFPFFSW